MNARKQVITFISRSAPYGSNRANLCLDAVLAAAVFEQNIHYVFLGDGVLQLLQNQDAAGIHQKTLGKALETLDLYGVDNVYVDKVSLADRNLSPADLSIAVKEIDQERLSELIQQSDTVFNL